MHSDRCSSVLWLCWLGGRKGIRPVKNWVVRCWCGYLSGARCRLPYAQLMPLPLTISWSSKIQIGFTFLVPAHPGSPGQRAVKRVCVCVCDSCSSAHCTYKKFVCAVRRSASINWREFREEWNKKCGIEWKMQNDGDWSTRQTMWLQLLCSLPHAALWQLSSKLHNTDAELSILCFLL